MDFDLELKQRLFEIESILKEYLPKEQGRQKKVAEAMNYCLRSGGKRLRPMLMAETFRFFGCRDLELLKPFMAAIEMIHTYSLVHDDLPCMDDDEYRRGRKTAHIVYGEAMALLAGDGLLNYAFETAAKAYHNVRMMETAEELTAYRRVLRALEILAEKAGVDGMIGGQVIDMEENEELKDFDRLDLMYRLKTGALIEASMMIGAVIAGAGEENIKTIEKIAGDIGLAFQIRDDILDMTSSTQVLGKSVHSDEKNKKVTYAAVLGVRKAEEEVLKISQRAIKEYEALPCQNEFLKALMIKLITREA